jgi:hypothetical protein
MRKSLKLSLLIFLSGCAGTPPEHQVPTRPTPSGLSPESRPFRFNCDTQPGKYSELNTAVSGASPWATGFIQVAATRPSSAWPPDAGVILGGAEHLPRVGLEAFVLPGQPETLQLAVRGTGGAADHTVFATAPVSGKPMRFTLKVSSSGELSLAVGDAKTTLSIGSVALTRVNLYCSSAHIFFSDVMVGSEVGPEAPN